MNSISTAEQLRMLTLIVQRQSERIAALEQSKPAVKRDYPTEAQARACVRELVEIAALRTGISVADITSKARTQDVVEARWWIMTQAKASGLSSAQTARCMGLDHATVLSGIKRFTPGMEICAPMFKSVRGGAQ